MIRKVALTLVGVLVAAAACLAIAILQHVDTHVMSDEQAARTFAEARARLADAAPLLDVDAQLQLAVHRDRRAPLRPIVVLHALSYSPQTHKFTRSDFPRWLLRLATANGRIRLLSIDIIQKDGERVTLEDLDRHGPGLIFDAQLPNRRLFVWSE